MFFYQNTKINGMETTSILQEVLQLCSHIFRLRWTKYNYAKRNHPCSSHNTLWLLTSLWFCFIAASYTALQNILLLQSVNYCWKCVISDWNLELAGIDQNKIQTGWKSESRLLPSNNKKENVTANEQKWEVSSSDEMWSWRYLSCEKRNDRLQPSAIQIKEEEQCVLTHKKDGVADTTKGSVSILHRD